MLQRFFANSNTVGFECRPRAVWRRLMALGLAAALAAATGCGREMPDEEAGHDVLGQTFPALEQGMTMSQVLAAWGTPNVKVREGRTERWSYWIRNHERRVIGRTYVLFGVDKKVSDIVFPQPPYEKREREPVTVTQKEALRELATATQKEPLEVRA
jgi:outer membrane protein assembly factor BamE (lipoprotein component of BamABCDE complex)